MKIEHQIGFIGAGQMARALAGGFVSAGLVEAQQIWASDPSEAARERFAAEIPGGQAVAGNREVGAAVDIMVLAVKPQQLTRVLADLKDVTSKRHLVISICAGVPLASIAAGLTDGVRLVRVMPNSPCLVGQSASGYCLGPGVGEADGRVVFELLAAVGQAFPVEETHLDAITGLAGSGPAFVYAMIEALSDGGVLMGLPREIATALAAQTVRGAAEMVLRFDEHPSVLKDRVTSPGGTTIAGLKALEKGGARSALIDAVQAATLRSIELGEQHASAS